MAAEGPFVDLELEHFLVGVHEVLVLVLVLQTVLEGEVLDILAGIQRGLDLGDDGDYFLDVGPEVGLQF